jgi:hypothetical protein
MLLAAIVIASLASCGRENSPLTLSKSSSADGAAGGIAVTSAPGVLINNYLVHFDGRVFDGNQTTFQYTVTGTGVEPALSHFTIELPDCAPELAAYHPTNSVSINHNPQTGIYGIEWHLAVEHDDLEGRQYSITFPGEVSEGVVYSAVKTGNETGVGRIPGPCAGFLIAGNVFVDANRNGVRDDADESGITDVVVELVAGDGSVLTAITDAAGEYRFIAPEGTFTVQVDLAGYPDNFNADLAASFDATSATSLQVTVGPDALGNDFGFAPQTEEIIDELETGVLVSNGESVKFWKKQLRVALNNGNGNAVYDEATLLGFIQQIEELFLETPYQFTAGNELQEAYDILRSNSQDELAQLYRELLATEFNEVSGRGLIGNGELQRVLIAWGEALIFEEQTAGKAVGGGADDHEISVDPEGDIADAVELFWLLNTGGGGGADE